MRISRFGLPPAVLAASSLVAACGNGTGDEPAPISAGSEQPAVSRSMPRTASLAGAAVFFITPLDGDTVGNPVVVEFGITGMAVVKAGEQQPQSGHHHLIIDASLPDLGAPIPANNHYVHFGDASTSTELTLEPGQHTLQLLLGDHLHVPHEPAVMSDQITITVE